MGIGNKIVDFAFLPQTAFSSSISIVVAQNAGAGQIERAKKATLYGIATCVAIGTAFCFFSQIFPTALPSMFTPDSNVQELCGDYIRAYSIDGIFASVVFFMTSMFTGFGRSGFSMINDLSSAFLMRIPITYFVSKMAGATLFQIGLASPIASAFSVLLCLLYLKFGRWKDGMSNVIARV